MLTPQVVKVSIIPFWDSDRVPPVETFPLHWFAIFYVAIFTLQFIDLQSAVNT